MQESHAQHVDAAYEGIKKTNIFFGSSEPNSNSKKVYMIKKLIEKEVGQPTEYYIREDYLKAWNQNVQDRIDAAISEGLTSTEQFLMTLYKLR